MKIRTLVDLKNWIQNHLLPKMTDKTIVLLSGKLGSGKTQLVKTYCELTECEQTAISPTFSIIQEYDSPKHKIYHVDLYRIEDANELENIGFWEIFEKPAQIFIEWPSKVDNRLLPAGWNMLCIEILQEGEDRIITIANQ